MNIMSRNNLKITILGLVILLVVFLCGPKPRVVIPNLTLNLPDDLDQYLADSESRDSDIIPNTEKKIFWANPDRSKTPLSIVYIHGYSATRQEVAPLCDNLADYLGANLFYTRLTGHGRNPDAMGQVTVEDWLKDALEAREIGKRIGEKVIIIGTSTGGSLAAWLATLPDQDHAAGYVLLSPNFGPMNKTAELLTWPWAKQIVLPLTTGSEYKMKPVHDEMARYWTESFPSVSLIQMMALVKLVRKSDLEGIQKPILVLYSPNDQIVNQDKTIKAFKRIGTNQKTIVKIEGNLSPPFHLLAGDIVVPENTDRIENIILTFFKDEGLKIETN
jgi:esterase/lipase